MKFLGLALIFISSVCFGFYSVYKDKCLLSFQSEILRFVEHTKEQIKHFNRPLNEIYSSFSSNNNSMHLFIELSKKYNTVKAVEQTKELLSPTYFSALTQFASRLGKTNQKDQVKLCEYTIDQLQKNLSDQKEKHKTNSKLKITLSIYIGLLLIILFL